jgi:hypothetical protein
VAAGWPGAQETRGWDLKDVLLYALSVGARPQEELPFLYEKFGPIVLPTYVTRLAGFALFEFVTHLVNIRPNPTLLLSTDLRVLRAVPVRCEAVTSSALVSNIRNAGDHLLMDLEVESSTDNVPLSIVTHTIRARGAASDGVPSEDRAGAAPQPDMATAESTSDDVAPEQYAIWRLQERISLDEPLHDEMHYDPEFTAANNIGAPFTTGESVLGFMCRAAIRILGDENVIVTRIGASFRGKVVPGDRLTTHLWRQGDGRCGLAVSNQDGQVVLSNGYIETAERWPEAP